MPIPYTFQKKKLKMDLRPKYININYILKDKIGEKLGDLAKG